jgi:hypothetical protein
MSNIADKLYDHDRESFELEELIGDSNEPYIDEISVLEKKIKDIKKLIEKVNKHFMNNELINRAISNKLFDIETIVNKEE